METKQNVFSNLIWRFLERCGAQLISFVVSIVLARVLMTEVYGLVSKVTVITTILLVFVDSGMANSLIQKKDSDDLDFSSVFFFNIVFCLILYVGLFFAAPAIARFYRDEQLTAIVRVLGLTVVVSGVKNVQQAYVSKTLQFRRFFFATLGGTILAAVVGIYMALTGYGVWALVAKELVNVTVNTVILWLTVGWRPKKMFSFSRLRGLLAYGWKLLASGLLDTVYNKLYQLFIGALYTSRDLAFYDRGNSFPNLITENINSSIDSVLLPVLSSEQDDRSRVRDMTSRAIKVSSYIMMPLMMGLGVCATPIVRLLLTEKWLPCVPYLRIFCFTYAFYPLHTANLNAIKAVGRSDLFLILQLIKDAIGIAVLLATMRHGVFVMALSQPFLTIVCQVINAWPNRKLIDYPYLHQLRDMLPSIGLTVLMGACVAAVSLLGLPDLLTLVIQVPLGVAVYLAASKLFRVDSFEYVLSTVKKLLNKRKAA